MNKIIETEDLIKNLNKLIELDYDAIAAYKAAIERIDDPHFKDQFIIFMQEHFHHIEILIQLVCQEEGRPLKSRDAKQVLSEGKSVISELSGDKAILNAMKMNEYATTKIYETEVIKCYKEPIQTILMAHLADECRHKEWFEVTLFE